MDRSLIQALLRQTESQVRQYELRIARQEEFVSLLASHGKPTAGAQALLNELRSYQVRCIFNRDRVLAELNGSAAVGATV